MTISEQDYELLSAYLDDMLETSQRAELEVRLNTDIELRDELNALRQTVQLIRSLPQLAAPRSYTLTPEQALKIRSERVRPAAAEGRILRLVIPIFSAAAAMMLVLFGLALLLNSPNGGMSTQTAAIATMTQSADTGSVPLRSVGTPTVARTPTVAATMSMTEDGVEQIMLATEDAETNALFDAQPEVSTGMTDEDETAPADMAGAADAEADEPDLANAEEEMAGEAEPLATFDNSIMRAVDPDDLPDGLTDLIEPPSAVQTAEVTVEVTAVQTATVTPSPTPSPSPTQTATAAAVIPAPGAPSDGAGGIDAAPPPLIGLILVGLGVSLGVITLVMTRRAGRTGGETGD